MLEIINKNIISKGRAPPTDRRIRSNVHRLALLTLHDSIQHSHISFTDDTYVNIRHLHTLTNINYNVSPLQLECLYTLVTVLFKHRIRSFKTPNYFYKTFYHFCAFDCVDMLAAVGGTTWRARTRAEGAPGPPPGPPPRPPRRPPPLPPDRTSASVA